MSTITHRPAPQTAVRTTATTYAEWGELIRRLTDAIGSLSRKHPDYRVFVQRRMEALTERDLAWIRENRAAR